MAAIRDRLFAWGWTERPVDDTATTIVDSASSSPTWQNQGPHRFYLRGDVLFWECHGPMNRPDVMVLFDLRVAVQRRMGRVFLLVDARHNTGVPAESRRYAANFKPDPPLQGAVVVFGAGLIVRTAVTLIISATRLLGRGDLKMMFFASNEAEAWSLIQRERLTLSPELSR